MTAKLPPERKNGAASIQDLTLSNEEVAASSETISVDHIHIDSRVVDAFGFAGTVAYIGPVVTATNPRQIYAGIIWDDPSRGKHDGSVIDKKTGQRIRYCTGSSSFIKLQKVGLLLTPRLLLEKYVMPDSDECLAPNQRLSHMLPTGKGRFSQTKAIELYGEKWIRQYQQVKDLHTLCLRRMSIRDVMTTATMERDGTETSQGWDLVQCCRNLDVSGNLICHWDAVNNLFLAFTNLKSLSLAHNQLGDWKADWTSNLGAITKDSLTRLNLHNAGITSIRHTLLPLGLLFTNLEELIVASTEWKDINTVSSQDIALSFPKLKVLDVSSSGLKSDDVRVFTQLSNLETLILDQNPLIDLTFVEDSTWPKLQHLQIVGTNIDSEQQLEPLLNLPSLRSLHVRNCPLTFSLGPAPSRSAIIARMNDVAVLNASPVSDRERRDAERRWLQQHSQLNKGADNLDDNDPLWNRLWPKHKAELEQSVKNNTAVASGDAWTLANCIINVTLESHAASSCTQPSIQRRLPLTLPVRSVQTLFAKHFGLRADLQILHYRRPEDSLSTQLDDPEQTLSYFGVTDGSTIIMDERDIAAEEKARCGTQVQWEAKLQEQEAEALALQKVQQSQGVVTMSSIYTTKSS